LTEGEADVAEISAAQVKELRERTGAGMMDCKKVLAEAQGDLERATDLLRERGIVKARSKADRATSEGRVAASVAPDGRAAALVEVNCETDFVAKTGEFAALAQTLADLVRERAPRDGAALLALPVDGATANDRVVAAIARLGENVRVRRLARLASGPGGRLASYIHAGGKIGAIVQLEAADPARPEVAELAKNLCMHVSATSPLAVSRDALGAGVVEKERAMLRKQAEQEGKPPQILEKMVEGRLKKFFQEVCLVEQPLVMDPDRSVAEAAKAAGARVVDFRRFQLGEEGE
jgi:elongation factor Ts